MKTPLLLLAGGLFAAASAFAQPGPGGTDGGAPGGQPQLRPGGPPPGSLFDPTNAPGWSMMNETERGEMRRRMEGFRQYDDCKAYMDEHRERMRSRGAATGPGAGDPCRHLKRG